jgi:hypothetical protein
MGGLRASLPFPYLEKKMKVKTILFTGHKCSEALRAFGHSIGAQFRNGHLAEDTKEPCDFVCGAPIPKSYSEVDIHPKWEEFDEDASVVSGDGSGKTLPTASNTEKEDGDDDEIDVTAEYLESLTKKEMMELVDEEKLEFTTEQKKNATNLLAALKAHYEV